jgi:flavin-dependent dehydrogenase
VTTVHDAAILGATPAGFAAAYALRRAGKTVVVVDAPPSADASPLADWTSADFFRLPHLPAGLLRAAKGRPFSTVCYHNVGLDRQVPHRRRAVAGYFMQAAELTAALAAAARKAKVRVRTSATVPVIRLAEDAVCVSGSTEVEARLLIIAAGQPYEVLGDLGLAGRTARPSPLTVAGLDVPVSMRGDGALHVVEEPERSEIGLFFVLGSRLHLRIVSSSAAAGTRAAELSAMVARLQQARILPARLPLHRARGAVWRPPAGMALELDTHVAKRCVLAGTAGGFCEPVTGATLYAATASALLAAEAGAKALSGRDLHAPLAAYGSLWRKHLETRLLRPATPFQVLLPLVFANPKVAGRLTATLLYAERGAR